ncbi:NAD(P)-dependent oxidoreductase [Schlegelella sp. S2-27]|uniref:NAD(P)-dependent oxidoreductase n=1 Tax=Caldimonas mangrovi TaxID=2944811 RepID=A0ABT0YK72_9BURK|nr:NAD(P)-dependent oxidoreductase [Caldimonas mangrovi]MCM5679133.1 NAD(P)-dependent oxidoreductase [Caldimonas mangrovi]
MTAAAQRIGIVGVGNMGGAMAERLLSQGWPVAVRDVDAAREHALAALGAVVCATPAELAARSDCVIVAVVDAAQTEAVLFGPDGIATTLAPERCVMLCPTIAPDCTEACAQRLTALGLHCIDAPMSGGPARARNGSMSLMVACSTAVFERHATLLGVLSGHVFRLGERIGDGARTKLVNNLLAGINLAAAAQAVLLAERLGLDAVRTLEVIEQSSGQSWIGSDRMHRALAGDVAVHAHTALLAKDTRLALDAAGAAGVRPTLGVAAASLFAQACAAGHASLDDSSLLDFLR